MTHKPSERAETELELVRRAVRENVAMVATDGSTSGVAVMQLTAMLERLYEWRAVELSSPSPALLEQVTRIILSGHREPDDGTGRSPEWQEAEHRAGKILALVGQPSGEETPTHPEDFCERCGRPNVVWFAPNDIWNKAVPEGGILCPVCFVQAAEKVGFAADAWCVIPEGRVRALRDSPLDVGADPAPRTEGEAALVTYLEMRIREGEESEEAEDDASWGYETGVLLSRAQARIALAALRGIQEASRP